MYEERLRVALKKTFGIKDFKAEPLAGGFSNAKLYKILVNNKDYVLRLSNNELKDMENEIKCMTLASRIGVSPKVYYANAQEGVMIMDYIKNKKLIAGELSDPKVVIQLATLLHRLHNEKPLFPKYRYKTVINFLLEMEKSLGCPNKSNLVYEGIKKLKAINKKLVKIKLKKSSHNDLNPNNILYDGKRFWIIDWEAAGCSDPVFDLATVSNFMIYNKKLEALYLKTYFKEIPTKIDRDHYLVMKQVSRCYYGVLLTFMAKNFGSQPLTVEEIQELDLENIQNKLNDKKMSLANPHDMEVFAAALIKAGLNAMNGEEFQKSLSNL
ncbi:MAG TPA: choline/ethanolamine kinase family protein [Gammaproteobacteria bacterium]|nr:choline/ethanolamine kinase family protein [Gammaproteobacteria bacterium]